MQLSQFTCSRIGWWQTQLQASLVHVKRGCFHISVHGRYKGILKPKVISIRVRVRSLSLSRYTLYLPSTHVSVYSTRVMLPLGCRSVPRANAYAIKLAVPTDHAL